MKIELFGESGDLQQTIEVAKTESTVDEGFDYHIRNTITGIDGFVEITLRDLSYFYDTSPPLFKKLERLVPEDETIAEIERFYPHGEPLKSRIPKMVQRKGIATSVLRTILHDLHLEEGLNHFYSKSPEQAFYSLLLNERFREFIVNDGNEHLYRRIGAKVA
jgi:hypothetical protein